MQSFKTRIAELETLLDIESRSYSGISDERRRELIQNNTEAWYEQLKEAQNAFKDLYAARVATWKSTAVQGKGRVFDRLNDIPREWSSIFLSLFEEVAGAQTELRQLYGDLCAITHRGTHCMRLHERPVTRVLREFALHMRSLLASHQPCEAVETEGSGSQTEGQSA